MVGGVVVAALLLSMSPGPAGSLRARGVHAAAQPTNEPAAISALEPRLFAVTLDASMEDVKRAAGISLDFDGDIATVRDWLAQVPEWPPAAGTFLRVGGVEVGLNADESGDRTVLLRMPHWADYFPPAILIAILVSVGLSAFYSGAETAFFSIHRLRLRSLGEERGLSGRLVASMMEHPGRLLTTILLGNMIVNVLFSMLLGTRVEDFLRGCIGLPPGVAYTIAVASCTGLLFFFGELSPKIVAVHTSETFARLTALPLHAADRFLAPLRDLLLRITDRLFALVRFHEVRAAPFITDEEFKSVLSDGEAKGVIEQDERQMIQGILEFSDALLREILVPRPDVVALPETATVGEALALHRKREYSRMPVYQDDLDHVTGILVAKDLLPSFAKGDLGRCVKTLARPVHFVPETMTVRQFVKDAQRHRAHLAAVVDEYGGTAGIVTLEDAIEQVVGDIMDEDEQEVLRCKQIGPDTYRVEGGMPLDELSEMIGIALEDEEHETVGGFLMKLTDKVPEPGDEFSHDGVRFTVEACEGKRVSSVCIQIVSKGTSGGGRPA